MRVPLEPGRFPQDNDISLSPSGLRGQASLFSKHSSLRVILGYMAILQRLPVDEAQLEAFCRQWKITKLELFGSMLVEPSRAQDIDLLVTFAPDARWGLFEHEHMQNELSGLLGRSVELISRSAVEASGNALRRNAILSSVVPVYVAG
jgi:uncharacterized protein